MRPQAEYRALRDIKPDGSWALAFTVGQDVTEDQRANLGLVVGEDVTPITDTAMHRPADDDDRLEWQNYAVVRGVPLDEASALDRPELIKRVGNPPDDTNGAVPLAPGEADRKALWAEYAAHRIVLDTAGRVDLGTARTRANAASKPDLVAAFGRDGTDGHRAPFYASVEAPQGPRGQILAVDGETVNPLATSKPLGEAQPDNTAEQAKTATRGGRSSAKD